MGSKITLKKKKRLFYFQLSSSNFLRVLFIPPVYISLTFICS